MESGPELIRALRREEIEESRRMPSEEKLRAGAELFDFACAVSLAGIRVQHPQADEVRIAELLRQRLEIGERGERLGVGEQP